MFHDFDGFLEGLALVDSCMYDGTSTRFVNEWSKGGVALAGQYEAVHGRCGNGADDHAQVLGVGYAIESKQVAC